MSAPQLALCHRCRGTGYEPDWRDLGQRVRAARRKRGIGLRDAARRLRVSASHLSLLERGQLSWQGPKARAFLTFIGLGARRA